MVQWQGGGATGGGDVVLSAAGELVSVLLDEVELGEVIGGSGQGRTHAGQITVVDLTGVATQDIAIATAIYRSVTHAD